tara:strand:+ start:25 stop:789 length:765 start_codon:yes stop_codon:yes gene_type:complete
MNDVKFYKNLDDISDNNIGLLLHFGLGDHIILNGLINFLSTRFNEIHLVIEKKLVSNLTYLYEKNKKIIFHIIDNPMEDDRSIKFQLLNSECEKIGQENGINFLRIGFENVQNTPFNLAFYDQVSLPYSYSFKYFSSFDNKEKEESLLLHLKDFYNIDKDFILIHNESSMGPFNLNNIDKDNGIYVTKDSDIYNNLFYYKKAIEEAKEIHCLDSSFLHLVERTDTDATLFFHDLFIASVKLTKNWNYIYYYDKN